MKNKFKWSLLAAVALVATAAMAADKYISSSGNIVLKTATSKSVNLQDTVYATQAGNVGIGTTAPAGKFDVNGLFTVLSNGNVGVGTTNPQGRLSVAHSGTNSTALVLGDPSSTSYDTGIYLRTQSVAHISTGSATGTLALNPTGNGAVVIGNTSASTGARFDVSGQTGGVKMCLSGYTGARRWYLNNDSAGLGIYFNGNPEQIKFNENGTVTFSSLAGSGSRTVTADASGTLSAASDIRLKKLAQADLPGLAEVMKLQPRSYKWKSDIKRRGKSASVEIGFIANEVNKVIPAAAPMGADGYYGLYDRTLIAALVKATQEQQKIIDLQKAWICEQADAPEALCAQ